MSDDQSADHPEDDAPEAPQAGDEASTESFQAPHPGSKAMPRWNTGPLIDAPKFTWKMSCARAPT